MVPATQAPCFIQLGRYGDLILLLPAFQAIHDRTGHKPIVIVSTDYASVLDGVSYVEPFPVHFPWWQGIPQARRIAEEQFGGAIIPQWWHVSPKDNMIEQQFRGATVLQCHGHEWGVELSRWPNFMTSMWERAGFTVEEMRALPLVFDRRDRDREALLLESVRGRNAKPMLLLSFFGHSSPFGPWPEVMRVVNRFAHQFHIVTLGQPGGLAIKAKRIFDLLGLFDAAAGMLTIDTATLHLAAGSAVPYIGFTRDDWSSSVCKGNCALEVKYGRTLDRLGDIEKILERWAGTPARPASPVLGPNGGGGGVIQL